MYPSHYQNVQLMPIIADIEIWRFDQNHARTTQQVTHWKASGHYGQSRRVLQGHQTLIHVGDDRIHGHSSLQSSQPSVSLELHRMAKRRQCTQYRNKKSSAPKACNEAPLTDPPWYNSILNLATSIELLNHSIAFPICWSFPSQTVPL